MRPQRMKEFEFRLGKLGLVLFVITFVLNYVADFFLNRQEERY